jgi:hypothetical protein
MEDALLVVVAVWSAIFLVGMVALGALFLHGRLRGRR